ncbi:MAG: hypothetical protein OXJ52_07390 [Oligoflexia bacterium]|nr:hypothetical protein [Oligoflexia bacterium]
MPEQPFVIEEDTESWEEKTEGGFCAFCDLKKILWENPSFRHLWSVLEVAREKAFKTRKKLNNSVKSSINPLCFFLAFPAVSRSLLINHSEIAEKSANRDKLSLPKF